MLTPNASSTSALPQNDVAAREPCFATGTPAPAMTKAAAVETLKAFASARTGSRGIYETRVTRVHWNRAIAHRLGHSRKFFDRFTFGSQDS